MTGTGRQRPSLRVLLSQPAYRRLWVARTVSQVGDVAQFTSLALLLVALTGSGLGVTAAVLAEIAPVLLLGPVAGSLVDRLPRVRVMVAADLVRVLVAATLALWHDSAAVAYVVAFGLSAGQVFFSPAAQSLLPAVVRDDELVAANSGIWTAAVTAQIAVAPVAALLATEVGFGAAFTVNAFSFALSAAALRGLREPERTTPVHVRSPFTHAREALAALGQIPLLKALAVGQFVAALSAGATSALLVVLAEERLGGGEGYGLLVAAIGAGAAVGPLLLRRVDEPRRPLFVFGPYAVRGLVDLVLTVVTTVPLAAAALVVYGLSTSTGNVTFSSLVQSRVPEELRGRAFAGFDVLWQTGRMLSLLGGGLLADAVGIRAVYLLGGLLLLGGAMLGGLATRSTPAAWGGS
ncbi:MAG: MFS transporter [Actinomycetota bacterium]|nr:MFS transporter [Actinomycetota bacterium]